MLNRLREAMFGVGRRVSAVGSGFVDTFLRDNRVIPIVLALLALLVFAWIVAGAFLGDPPTEPVWSRAGGAQPQNPPTSDPAAPEVENPDVDTYAAYQFKDPFRQLFAPAGSTTPTTTPTTTPEETTGGGGGGGAGGGGGGAGGGLDTDGDGLSDEREARLGLNPTNPDTDGDGTLDGQEEEARGGNGGAGGRGNGGLPGSGGQKGALPESGGEIPLQ